MFPNCCDWAGRAQPGQGASTQGRVGDAQRSIRTKPAPGNRGRWKCLKGYLELAGGRGSRMAGLTAHRAKPSVCFGGKYRIVDFALSNCVNSGLRRIGILTQYKSQSLLAHVRRGWNFLKSEVNEFVELLPAQQQIDDEGWYKGTADAVRQNIGLLRARRPKYILILAGDHIYKMDYRRPFAAVTATILTVQHGPAQVEISTSSGMSR
jgi:ADP-glucose pyrophosphorylase